MKTWLLAPLKGEGVAGEETRGATLFPSESPSAFGLFLSCSFPLHSLLSLPECECSPQALTGLVVSQGAATLSALPSHGEAPAACGPSVGSAGHTVLI